MALREQANDVRRKPLTLWLVVLIILPGAASAETECFMQPEGVLARQLDALQRNDMPYPDAGIAETWKFAHPANRAATGPLPRFTDMLKSAAYRGLLNHLGHATEPLGSTPDEAAFKVTVQTRQQQALEYSWVLQRVDGGEYDGCWMTTVVTAPARLGDII